MFTVFPRFRFIESMFPDSKLMICGPILHCNSRYMLNSIGKCFVIIEVIFNAYTYIHIFCT